MTDDEERRRRRVEALRANLRRRKAQARDMPAPTVPPRPAPDDAPVTD